MSSSLGRYPASGRRRNPAPLPRSSSTPSEAVSTVVTSDKVFAPGARWRTVPPSRGGIGREDPMIDARWAGSRAPRRAPPRLSARDRECCVACSDGKVPPGETARSGFPTRVRAGGRPLKLRTTVRGSIAVVARTRLPLPYTPPCKIRAISRERSLAASDARPRTGCRPRHNTASTDPRARGERDRPRPCRAERCGLGGTHLECQASRYAGTRPTCRVIRSLARRPGDRGSFPGTIIPKLRDPKRGWRACVATNGSRF